MNHVSFLSCFIYYLSFFIVYFNIIHCLFYPFCFIHFPCYQFFSFHFRFNCILYYCHSLYYCPCFIIFSLSSYRHRHYHRHCHCQGQCQCNHYRYVYCHCLFSFCGHIQGRIPLWILRGGTSKPLLVVFKLPADTPRGVSFI